uniref:G-protein coupled receptors family 1 profile domain-containing protein n=1 Tax=Spongospora subterranea TaxID=70186 RepID=A0A0H5R8Q9_9EUKA|eukprot:CRZ10500.1 hypothetical protein [Spongospora subterranea]
MLYLSLLSWITNMSLLMFGSLALILEAITGRHAEILCSSAAEKNPFLKGMSCLLINKHTARISLENVLIGTANTLVVLYASAISRFLSKRRSSYASSITKARPSLAQAPTIPSPILTTTGSFSWNPVNSIDYIWDYLIRMTYLL